MAHSAPEPSSSLSFTSNSNGSISPNSTNTCSCPASDLKLISLAKLSSNLEHLLLNPDPDFSDALIIVEGIPISVHRCILASRSRFFGELFKSQKVKGSSSSSSSSSSEKLKYSLGELLPYGHVGYEAFLIFLGYVYAAKLNPSPMEVSTCVDDMCVHDACRPAINFVVELMYASSIFQIPELVSLFQRRLLNFVEKALAEDVIPILMVAFHCQLKQLVTQCVDRLARSDLDRISIEKELPLELSENVKLLRRNSSHDVKDVDPLLQKRIGRIHKALDSHDVELVELLLSESEITLDEANALHYAVAYCDSKLVSDLLGLHLADINLRNSQGYTVLHIAAMRKEPSIIVSLLTKGACASDLTFDGRSAVSICRRLIRRKDYHTKTEKGKVTNKDRICIDVLEREMLRNPIAGDNSMSAQMMADDLHMKLQYLENRVAFARLFFPREAKLAMDIAHAETKSESVGLSASKGSNGNLREVDLNETPIMKNKRLLLRMEALLKTVEMGRRYFPHCSEVLDKFMDDDLPDLFCLEKGTQEEQRIKRMRFMELKDDVQKAFNKDRAQFSCSRISSPSPSSSLRGSVHYKARKV